MQIKLRLHINLIILKSLKYQYARFSINYYLPQLTLRNIIILLNVHRDPFLNNTPLLHNNSLNLYKIQMPSKCLGDPIS